MDEKQRTIISNALQWRDSLQYDRTQYQPEYLVLSPSDSMVDFAKLSGLDNNTIYHYRALVSMPYIYSDTGFNQFALELHHAITHYAIQNIILFMPSHDKFCQILCQTINQGGVENPQNPLDHFMAEILSELMGHEREIIENIATSSAELLGNFHDLLERAVLVLAMNRLMSYPIIHQSQGGIAVQAWWYDMENGDIWVARPNEPFLPADILLD